MREEAFAEVLQSIRIPLGEALSDGVTYRVTAKDFPKINTRHMSELSNFDKFGCIPNSV